VDLTDRDARALEHMGQHARLRRVEPIAGGAREDDWHMPCSPTATKISLKRQSGPSQPFDLW